MSDDEMSDDEMSDERSGQMFTLTKQGASDELIAALRIYHTTLYDFDTVTLALVDKPISHQNELDVSR